MARILIIEDDEKIRKLIAMDMELEDYGVLTAANGVDGLETAKREKPDLVILDLMMPGMSGYDVCRALRKDKSDVPIIMLTAKGQDTEKALGLDMGADDYLSKPFSGIELRARVKALLRRHRRELEKVKTARFADVEVDFAKLTATKSGAPIELTHKEFQILELLIRHKGEVVSRRQFLDEVWGYDAMPTTRTVDNQLLGLRQKLFGKSPDGQRHIVTVHGAGYKFVD
jgi:two-component system alkaline phosphatase synthesis response regulator PhoP